MHHVQRVQQEQGAGLVDVVSTFGDGQRDDARVRGRKPPQHGFGIGRRVQVFDHGANHARGDPSVGPAGGDGVQPVLTGERGGLRARRLAVAQANAADAPVFMVRQMQAVLDGDSLMHAVEVADAGMHDAGPQHGAVVAGDRDTRADLRESFARQVDHG